jgi:mono/diheme cytochrome c family protein
MMDTNQQNMGRSIPVTLSPCHLVTLSLLLAAGCDLPGRPAPGSRPEPADQVTDFGVLYAERCAGCHGADGKLGPAPPLNDPIFLAIVPDAELLRVIREGRSVTPGQKSPMPAFAHEKGGPLTGAQVKALAEGIKKHWELPASPSGSLPAYIGPAAADGGRKDHIEPIGPPKGASDNPSKEGDGGRKDHIELIGPPKGAPVNPPVGARAGRKEEGARVFARACAGCHGPQGKGGKDGDRPGSRDGGAINDQAFLALISDQELRRYAITGRPDLGMPAYNGKDGRAPDFQPLTSAEIDDLVALLASWRLGGPANGR